MTAHDAWKLARRLIADAHQALDRGELGLGFALLEHVEPLLGPRLRAGDRAAREDLERLVGAHRRRLELALAARRDAA